MTEEKDTRQDEIADDAGAPQSEEELRAQLEEELRKVRVEDVLLQSVASLINLSARRIAKDDERDLSQAKVGIDAVRAVVDLLPEEAAVQVRNALSELQVLYAKHAEGDKIEDDGGGADEPQEPPPEKPKTGSDSGIWTPPGT